MLTKWETFLNAYFTCVCVCVGFSVSGQRVRNAVQDHWGTCQRPDDVTCMPTQGKRRKDLLSVMTWVLWPSANMCRDFFSVT